MELLSFYNVLLVSISMKTLFSLNSIMSFLRTHVGFCDLLSMPRDEQQEQQQQQQAPPPLVKNGSGGSELRAEDLGIILSRIGLDESDSLEGRPELRVNPEALCDLFAEEEPSLAEVKAAFAVFDEGGDGFIDEFELQRVLAKLGIAEGSDLGSCRRMIEVYDQNRDGKIDFSEFVKFMEISLC